jgi:hypothetical protein
VPGTQLYSSAEAQSPMYDISAASNRFIHYKLDAPLYLNPGTFYVGFEQNTDQFLNVGVDKNTNTQSKIFYNVSGTWLNPSYTGSLMMHPVFGSFADFVGVEDEEPAPKRNNVGVYPNPANDVLFIKRNDFSASEKINYSITDLLGRTVIENALYDQSIDISALQDGIYFIKITEGLNTSTTKFIKVK